MTQLSRELAEGFYQEHKGKPFFENLVNFMISDFIVGMELVRFVNYVSQFTKLKGCLRCNLKVEISHRTD